MPCDEALADALARYLSALADPLDRRVLAPLVIDEILYRLLRSDAAAAVRAGVGPAADAQRMLEIMRFIRTRHADKLRVEQLARRAAMSPSHFAHRFRAVARISPMRYLREVRLDAARARLLDPSARVSEVAVEVGFESPAHFTREFKRRFGVSPSKSFALSSGG
jgi:AraC-like DNA-binding protein